MEKLQLVRPTMNYEKELLAFRREFIESGDSMDGSSSLRRYENIKDWLMMLDKMEDPDTVPEGFVPATLFLYVREADQRVVGMIQIRRGLNDFLENYGGHIGYCVRPSERRKGYAKAMLQETLVYCSQTLGLPFVLISCLENNEASRRTILSNGGKYINTVFWSERGVNLQRYKIELEK